MLYIIWLAVDMIQIYYIYILANGAYLIIVLEQQSIAELRKTKDPCHKGTRQSLMGLSWN